MKRIICTLMGFAALTAGFDAAAAGRKTSVPEQKEQPTPRLRFTGDPFAQQATAVFAETLHDMRSKIEYGSNERFPAGFFHTSTEPEGVPQYYNDMWTRDCGRGVIELSRLGFADDARLISRYFLAHITDSDHWGRELHHSAPHVELDGNVLILSGICSAWRANGMERGLGREFCDGIAPVVAWIDSLTRVSPYGGLLPSTSELSGNPSTDYPVYSIFGNYGIYTVMAQIADMAAASGRPVRPRRPHGSARRWSRPSDGSSPTVITAMRPKDAGSTASTAATAAHTTSPTGTALHGPLGTGRGRRPTYSTTTTFRPMPTASSPRSMRRATDCSATGWPRANISANTAS